MTVIENLLVPPRDQFEPSIWKSIWEGRDNENEVNRLSKAYEVLEQLETPIWLITLQANYLEVRVNDIGRSMMENLSYSA